VEVLDDQEEGLHVALPEQQAFERIQRGEPALRRIERLPGGLLNWDIQQAEDGGQTRLEGCIKGLELGGDLLAARGHRILLLELKVGLEQVDDRQVRGGFTRGGRAGGEDLPAMEPRPADELIAQARLSYAGFSDHPQDLFSPLLRLPQEVLQDG
jgi:hypothetical protein